MLESATPRCVGRMRAASLANSRGPGLHRRPFFLASPIIQLAILLQPAVPLEYVARRRGRAPRWLDEARGSVCERPLEREVRELDSSSAASIPRESFAPELSRRERRKLEVRTRILDAAREIFREQSYATTRVTEICERAD